MITFSYKGSGYWTICLFFGQKILKELRIALVIFLVAIKISFRLFSIPFFWTLPLRKYLSPVIIDSPKGFERSLSV